MTAALSEETKDGKVKHHRWPTAGNELREQYRTVRLCLDCGISRVTRHEPEVFPWVEWFDVKGDRIKTKDAPPCEVSAP